MLNHLAALINSFLLQMSLLRRLPLGRMRNLKVRGGGPKESFFAEGKNEPTGYLFNETPLPAGQSRKWESWEAPW